MNPSQCWYWHIDELEVEPIKLHWVTIDRTKQICVKCCSGYEESTPLIPCECITDPQTFSSARKHF